jgi:hypothetical protein
MLYKAKRIGLSRPSEEQMGSLTALLLATPIFGLSLHAPMAFLDEPSSAAVFDVDLSAKAVAAADVAAKQADSDKAESDEGGKTSEQDEYKQELKRRNSIAGIHRVFGLATWAAMTLTIAAGVIDYYNLYGFGAGIGDNPCVKGSAAFGDDFGCRGGIRTIKSAAAYVTTALYATTFTLSLMMPDPDDLASGKGEFASTLRLHKTLRWVHFSGMCLQIALGLLIASRVGGLDRANDYGTLQALATVHMAAGLITWGALTWAGALMTF